MVGRNRPCFCPCFKVTLVLCDCILTLVSALLSKDSGMLMIDFVLPGQLVFIRHRTKSWALRVILFTLYALCLMVKLSPFNGSPPMPLTVVQSWASLWLSYRRRSPAPSRTPPTWRATLIATSAPRARKPPCRQNSRSPRPILQSRDRPIRKISR